MRHLLPVFKKSALALALAAGTALASTAQANEVEVLHWWTSGGEARAANVLKELLEAEGYGWQDCQVTHPPPRKLKARKFRSGASLACWVT